VRHASPRGRLGRRWVGDKLDGILDNEPEEVSGLKLGARVTVKLGEVADYVQHLKDGTDRGGYSVEILRAAQ
jgi:uncharacterized protein YegJ (DUF2314 family)